MSTPPAPKRRRVDSLGIHKPFVSPLKRNAAPLNTTTSIPAPSRTQPTPSTPYTPLRSSNLKTSTPLHLHPHDPEIVATQQAIKHLEARIRVLRSQNGILAQAVQITTIPATSSQPSSGPVAPDPATSTPPSSSSTKQPRLIRLTHKWKKATQLAAEEVFTSFSQNIKDNGGYTSYLQNQRQSQSSASAFFNDEDDTKDATNEEDWRDEDGDVLTERGKRQRRGEMEEKEYGYRGDGGGDEDEDEEEEELSLGTMLQVLNIDPEVIGWNSKTLAWK
jgi:Swi5-dependent recombination DNA repair protein 1